jgi:glycosyltransferase involved in cell wall biosynthesis
VSTDLDRQRSHGARPSWLRWSDEPLPAYAAPILAAIAAEGHPAFPEGHVFCPDGLALGPGEAAFTKAVVALPGDLGAVAAAPEGDARRQALSAWIAAGATLLVPTRTGVALLAGSFGADRDRCRVVALPLAGAAGIPRPERAPEDGYILVDRPIWHALHPYLRALRLAGCDRRVVLVADDASPQLAPGGDIAMDDLVPGVDVSATLERGPAVAGAAVIVRTETAIDAGHELRACLASGRPLVVNGEPAVRDHLEAIGASAYLYPGLDAPIQAAEATIAALAHTRGEIHRPARDAVLAESAEEPARVVTDLLLGEPSERALREPPASGALSDRPGMRIAVIAPEHRVGSAERFVREIVLELALHPSRPAVTLIGKAAATTPAARETEAALAERGGRAIAVGEEGIEAALAQRAGEFDVVWSTWPHRQPPPLTDVPLVTTFHDLHWRFFWSFAPAVVGEIEAQMPAWLERTALFVSSSEFIRGQLCEEYAVAPERTRVVPLTGMRPLPASRAAAAAVRRRFCLPRHFLLFPNGRHPHKNHMALERALEQLRAAGRPMTVVTTSDQTDTWFHGPDLIGLGYVSDETLRALYELSDGLVTPTLYEAGSFPMFEAMMVGRPVACSRIPPLVEQLERDGAEAELFDPNDPADIAAALRRLRGMGTVKRARLVRHNRLAVGSRSWADVADGYMRAFGEAVAAAQVPAAIGAGDP